MAHKVAQQTERNRLILFPMDKWRLYSDFKNGKPTGGRIQFIWLFSIIGVFVLLLACINFMNLSTARSEKRAKEVGIRKTVGSASQSIDWAVFKRICFSGICVFYIFYFISDCIDALV